MIERLASVYAAYTEPIVRGIVAVPSLVEERFRSVGQGVVRAVPSLAVPVLSVWYLYVYLYIGAVSLRNNVRYDAEIDPFRIYRVDLDSIYWSKRTTFPRAKFKSFGRTIGGDWDLDCEPFEETDLYRSFEAHFHRGVEWRETEYFQRVVGEIEDGQTRWGCETPEEFERRCREIDDLYERIARDGFKTQAELVRAEAPEDELLAKNRLAKIHRYVYDDVTVSVGRDGELIFNDGRHRFALAKVLDLDEIPVLIMVRHRSWQRFRDAVATGQVRPDEVSEDLRDHPDLRGLW